MPVTSANGKTATPDDDPHGSAPPLSYGWEGGALSFWCHQNRRRGFFRFGSFATRRASRTNWSASFRNSASRAETSTVWSARDLSFTCRRSLLGIVDADIAISLTEGVHALCCVYSNCTAVVTRSRSFDDLVDQFVRDLREHRGISLRRRRVLE